MKKFKNIVILSAGQSKRFWPLSDKNLFIFLGKPLICYQLEKLLPYAEKIFIVANENNAPVLRKIFLSQSKVEVIVQKGEGQASALLSLVGKVRGEVLLVNNIDVFNEKVILPEILKRKNNYQLILTAKEMEQYFPGGYFKLRGKQITALIEKPEPEKRPSNLVRLVVDYLADFGDFIKVLKTVTNPARDGAFEEGLNLYLKKACSTFIKYGDYWYFLKYPWHVLSLGEFFLGKISPYIGKSVFVDKSAKIEGNVYLDDGVKIYQFSKIVGPCYIGKNTLIGNYALVRQSIIGENCLIGGYSEVTRSYLGNKVFLHRNFLGDSVVENNVLFGAGAVCANFRFDEKEIQLPVNGVLVNSQRKKLGAMIGSNVKIGVNASLMPGARIATNSIVMPSSLQGLSLNKDRP